jgi:hypothetical protein
MDLVKLKKSAREIRENWEVIEALESNLLVQGNQWILEMALQGQRLIHVKTQLKHGDWLPWCEAQAPGRYAKINQCMKIAANFERVKNLSEAESLRQALALCAQDRPVANGEPKHWPAPVEANAKLAKFVGFVEKHPVTQWPAEQQEAAREKLLPIARWLWPERFA